MRRLEIFLHTTIHYFFNHFCKYIRYAYRLVVIFVTDTYVFIFNDRSNNIHSCLVNINSCKQSISHLANKLSILGSQLLKPLQLKLIMLIAMNKLSV